MNSSSFGDNGDDEDVRDIASQLDNESSVNGSLRLNNIGIELMLSSHSLPSDKNGLSIKVNAGERSVMLIIMIRINIIRIYLDYS